MSYETLDNNRMHCIDSLTISDAVIFISSQLEFIYQGAKRIT